MSTFRNNERMERENRAGIAAGRFCENLSVLGFWPAFYDYATCTTYLSRNADGSPALDHVLDGLPDEVVVLRGPGRHVLAAKSSLIAGFERRGFFYTRSAAARLAAQYCLLG